MAIGGGIEITARKAVFVFLAQTDAGVADITGALRPLAIGDDEDATEVKRFCAAAHAVLDRFRPDRIALIQRRRSGPFASGGLTFKIEGLLQLYPHGALQIISTQQLRDYARDTQVVLKPRFAYQRNAYWAARYILDQAAGALRDEGCDHHLPTEMKQCR
jgi:hypothetical protein